MKSETMLILPEPELEFRYSQKMQHPRDGLTLFGPYDADAPSHPKNITYGVIGTPEGISAFESWSETIIKPILTDKDFDPQLWPHFPGVEAAFFSSWSKVPAWSYAIDRDELLIDTRQKDANKRAFNLVNKYLGGISIARKKDEAFDILICIIPDKIWENCRPQSKIIEGIGYSVSKKERDIRAIQGDLFEEYDPFQYQLSSDFRRQLKARAMEYDIPLQIIRESTINLNINDNDVKRNLTPPSDIAWNLLTTIFYKSGGKPWRLHSARNGVCYVGIAFRREDPFGAKRTACCAAQMFLDSGDGIVFLGEYGPWYSPEKQQFHLNRDAARKLLSGVLNTYNELEGKRITEIFLHSRSTISKDEFEGYKLACPEGTNVIGVRVNLDHDGLRLFREGSRVALRGTFWKASARTGFLLGSGFKPRLLTYDGWEIPVPLRIDIEHGDADIEQVTKDIFGLTKLNYNTCKLGDSRPVTILFSDAVGEILVSNPTIQERRPNFKFYI
jgi:hypothetical protein